MSGPGPAEEPIAYFEGEYVPLSEARVPIDAHVVNYGTGCFEGIRAYWNPARPNLFVAFLAEHAARLVRSARILNLGYEGSEEEISAVVVELLRRNRSAGDTYVRPLIYKSGRSITVALGGIPTALSAYAMPMSGYFERDGGLVLRVSGWRRVQDAAVPARAKTIGSYVNAALASDEARRSGFDEALLLTSEGRLAEASSSNVFLVQGTELVTPSGTEDVLLGITRSAVLQLADELGLRATERPVHRSEVFGADEMFLCGTGVQISPVVGVDGRQIGNGAPGPVVRALAARYLAVVRGEVDDHADWRTPVYGTPAAPGAATG